MCTQCTVLLLKQKWINPLHKLYSCHHLYRCSNLSMYTTDYNMLCGLPIEWKQMIKNNRNFLCANKNDNWSSPLISSSSLDSSSPNCKDPSPTKALLQSQITLFSYSIFCLYRSLHNSITSSLRKDKSSFFSNLSNLPPLKILVFYDVSMKVFFFSSSSPTQ